MSGDHNENQKPTTNDLKECGTCGYPLLPEERTGLVEVNGKMVKPWVGLTDGKDWRMSLHGKDFISGALWAESLLKSKNGF